MAYSYKTPIYGIPVVGNGDAISPEVEMRKYKIIENLLRAGMEGRSNCVFDDGDFHLNVLDDGKCEVTIVPGSGVPVAIFGIASGAYFEEKISVTWANLAKGYIHYLYIVGTENTFVEPSSYVVKSFTREIASLDGVLVATVDYLGDFPILDEDPSGKMYADEVIRHMSNSSNPHGNELNQDVVNVSGNIVLGENASIKKITNGIVGDWFPSALKEEIIVEKILSPGPAGVCVKIENARSIMFANASVIANNLGLSAGDISIGYNNEDENVDKHNEIMVYNSGDQGIPMMIWAYCSAQ